MTMAIDPDWLNQHPTWENWAAAWTAQQTTLWEQAEQLRQRGHTLAQAAAALGLWPDDAENLATRNKELTDTNQRQHDTIAQQAATIKRQREHIEWEQLDPQAQDRMLTEAARRLQRQAQRRA